MTEPRFQRRKEDRPAEITEAAMQAFAEKGYAATRVDEVAKRAGVSKGLLYLYFKTKEDLFKAVIRSFVTPRVEALTRLVAENEMPASAFLRGPFLDFAKTIPRSPARKLVRLLVAEGPKHPDLIKWYWDNVVSHGLSAVRDLIRSGVERGEFRPNAVEEFPQLLIGPVLVSMLWLQLFNKHAPLDIDRLLESHVELLLRAIEADPK